jgi:hypothetical protein
MDVDWKAITAEGLTATNYQLMPGDRIYIQADKLIVLDNMIAKITAPIERVVGVTLLGYGLLTTANQGVSQGFNNGGGNNNSGFGGGF